MRWSHRAVLISVLRVVSWPKATLAICAMVLLGATAFSLIRLSISADQNELFSPKAPFFRDFLRLNQQFPENEAAYVLIEPVSSRTPPVNRWTLAADAVALRLRQIREHVRSVDARVPLDQLGDQGLLFEDPKRLPEILADMRKFVPLIQLWAQEPSAAGQLLGASPLQRFLAAMQLAPLDRGTDQFIDLLAQSWNRSLKEAQVHAPNLTGLDAEDPSRLGYYYVADATRPDRRLLLVRVYLLEKFESLTALSDSVDALRAALREIGPQFPEFRIALTGRPVLAADEMRTTDNDSTRAEIVALSAVFIGLVLLLRSLWLALAAELALGVGIGWTFGWATLTVGRLNLLSIVFLLALIGIGMDYLIQVLSRYRHEAQRRQQARLIWVAVFRQVGPPINTACLGAAAAFLVSVFTDFRGAAELGVIAGGGLLLCLLAGYSFLPAFLTLFPWKAPSRSERIPAIAPSIVTSAQNGGTWGRWMGPLCWAGLLIAGVAPALRTSFDPGLLELQAQNLESVKLVRKLETWSAVVLTRDLHTLRRCRQAAGELPVVARTESILSAIDTQQWLAQQPLPTIDWNQPQPVPADTLPAIATLSGRLAERFSTTDRAAQAGSETPSDQLAQFVKQLQQAPPEARSRYAEILSGWQRAFVEQLRSLMKQFRPEPLDIRRLPPELRGHYVSDDGTYALHIYPQFDLWKQDELMRFVKQLEVRMAAVEGEKTLTGIASNIFHSTASIRRSFYGSTLAALAIIILLVLIDMRRLTHTLAAISVLAMGLPMLLAVMGSTGVDWNFANFFGLPILIGAAHEYGVFMVHRYREARRDPSDPLRAWRGWDVADKALLLCAFVTSSSFGFFWLLAHHQGLRSLGMVMSLGSACTYLATVLVLRPVLRWRLDSLRLIATKR